MRGGLWWFGDGCVGALIIVCFALAKCSARLPDWCRRGTLAILCRAGFGHGAVDSLAVVQLGTGPSPPSPSVLRLIPYVGFMRDLYFVC